MTQKEFAMLGGEARAKKLSKRRRIEIARNAGLESARRRRIEADLKNSFPARHKNNSK